MNSNFFRIPSVHASLKLKIILMVLRFSDGIHQKTHHNGAAMMVKIRHQDEAFKSSPTPRTDLDMMPNPLIVPIIANMASNMDTFIINMF